MRSLSVAVLTLMLASPALADNAPSPFGIDLAVSSSVAAHQQGIGFGTHFPDVWGSRWSLGAGLQLFLGGDDGRPEVAQFSLQGEYALWAPAFYQDTRYRWHRSTVPRYRVFLFGRVGMADVGYPYAAEYPVYPDMTTQGVFITPGVGLRWQFSPYVTANATLGYEISGYDADRHRGLSAGLSLGLRP